MAANKDNTEKKTMPKERTNFFRKAQEDKKEGIESLPNKKPSDRNFSKSKIDLKPKKILK